MPDDIDDPQTEIYIGSCRCKKRCGGAKIIIKYPSITDEGVCFAVIQKSDIGFMIESLRLIEKGLE